MANGDGPLTGAAGTGCINKFTTPYSQGYSSGEPGKNWNIKNTDGHHNIADRGPPYGRDKYGCQNGREPEEQVGKPHNGLVRPFPEVCRNQTQGNSRHHTDSNSCQTHGNRVDGTHHDAGHNIPSVLVRTQKMAKRWRLQPVSGIHYVGLIRRPNKTDGRCQNNYGC